jgi:monoamine oxidase
LAAAWTDEAGRSSADGFDLGASWLWPGMQPAIAALVEELGLATMPQNSDGDVIIHRMAREAPQRYRRVASGHEPQSMRLVGGTGALVTALANDLPADRLQLGTRVTHMALGEGEVTLTVSGADDSTRSLTAGHVIATIPPRLLEATVLFTPEMDAATVQRWRDTPTWMAPHAKFFAFYDRPFWREAGLSGTARSLVGPIVEIHDATTASGAAALLGFLGVGPDQRAAMGEAALSQACIEQLGRLFGEEARRPHATLIKDWAADALTATAGDRSAGGHPVPNGGSWVSGPWQHRLSLGGSETSVIDPGYLAGAIESARNAVTDTLAKLRPDDLNTTSASPS